MSSSPQQKNEESLNGKVAIVTGGSSGIGRAACLALAQEGASVVVVGRNQERVDNTIDELRKCSQNGHSEDSYLGLVLDVSNEKDMNVLRERTMQRFERIDILIASAGIGTSSLSRNMIPSETSRLPFEEWKEVLDINLTGVFLSNRAVLPVMMQQKKGMIINLSSFHAGRSGQPYASAYSASKFAIIGFSESLEEEMRSYGIKVHVILPGLVETPMTINTALKNRFGKSLNADNIADLILYLTRLPDDVIFQHPVILPFMRRGKK